METLRGNSHSLTFKPLFPNFFLKKKNIGLSQKVNNGSQHVNFNKDFKRSIEEQSIEECFKEDMKELYKS